ncbi:MAG: copper homeostasis protein CutC [Pseudomonadota bacterium]
MTGSSNTAIISEICVDSIEGVRAAVAADATRVELCSALLEGGLTPSFGMTKQATAVAGPVGVHVMIRPRGGDFLYSDDEFIAMKDDIAVLSNLGVDGFVFGLLTSDGDIDVRRVAELMTLSRPAKVTFHRAFDMAKDPFVSLDALIDLGVDRLLTSGQAPGVLEGAPLIRDLIDRAAGRMVIMPGGDVSAGNVTRIIRETGAREIHFASFESQASPMRHRNPSVFMGGTLRPPEYDRTVTTEDGISKVLRATRIHG